MLTKEASKAKKGKQQKVVFFSAVSLRSNTIIL